MAGHWTETYVGRPYLEGDHDCATLVETVLRERFAINASLPPAARSIRARDQQVAEEVTTRWIQVLCPREGDVAVMRATGRLRTLGNHIGVHVDVVGSGHVLHCAAGVGTCLHAVAALSERGLEVCGSFRWL